jgi:hypothetical protein
MNDLIWITEANYQGGYIISLTFNDGVFAEIDFLQHLNKPIFSHLKDESYFSLFKLNSWTLEWPNGEDFAPEYLYQAALQKVTV